jgi:hypothetical protein
VGAQQAERMSVSRAQREETSSEAQADEKMNTKLQAINEAPNRESRGRCILQKKAEKESPNWAMKWNA